jgi:hypothetical protein
MQHNILDKNHYATGVSKPWKKGTSVAFRNLTSSVPANKSIDAMGEWRNMLTREKRRYNHEDCPGNRRLHPY